MTTELQSASADVDLVVREADDPKRWDAFVSSYSVDQGGSVCHLYGWHELLKNTLQVEPLYRVAIAKDGSWEGILPLFRVKSLAFGHYLVSMPFLNYGGPLGTSRGRHALVAWAVEEAQRSGADLLELRLRAVEASSARVEGVEVSHRRLTVVLDLPDDSDSLWSEGFRSKLRSQIRRPMKEGMRVEFGVSEVQPFYDVYSRNMRDLGTPVLPLEFFEALPRIFSHEVIFGVVYHGARPVAGGCGFLWGHEYEMTWASSLREYNRQAPNMLLYWAFMKHVIAAGADSFNFGRCAYGTGTHRFKRQWGAADQPLPWFRWSSKGAQATPTPEASGYRLATAVWRRLPHRVANLVGPHLARRIP